MRGGRVGFVRCVETVQSVISTAGLVRLARGGVLLVRVEMFIRLFESFSISHCHLLALSG